MGKCVGLEGLPAPGSLCFCHVLLLGSGHGSHATLQNVPRVSHSCSAQAQSAAPVLPAPCTCRRWDSSGGTAGCIYFPFLWIFSCATRSVPCTKALRPLRKTSISSRFQIHLIFWTNHHFLYREWPGLISFTGPPARTKHSLTAITLSKCIPTEQCTTFVFFLVVFTSSATGKSFHLGNY